MNGASDIFISESNSCPALAAVLQACGVDRFKWPNTNTSRSIWPACTLTVTPMTSDISVEKSCITHKDTSNKGGYPELTIIFTVKTQTWRAARDHNDPDWKEAFGELGSSCQGELRLEIPDGTLKIFPFQAAASRLWNLDHSVASYYHPSGPRTKSCTFEELVCGEWVRISIIPHYSTTMMAAIQNYVAGAAVFDKPMKEQYYADFVLPRANEVSTHELSLTSEQRNTEEFDKKGRAPCKLSFSEQTNWESAAFQKRRQYFEEICKTLALKDDQLETVALKLCYQHPKISEAMIRSSWRRAARAHLDHVEARPHSPSAYPILLQDEVGEIHKDLNFLETRIACEIRECALERLSPVWGKPLDAALGVPFLRWMALIFSMVQVQPYYQRILLGIYDSLSPLDAAIHHQSGSLPQPGPYLKASRGLPTWMDWADPQGIQAVADLREIVQFWRARSDDSNAVAFMMSRYQTCSYEEYFFLVFTIFGSDKGLLAPLPKGKGSMDIATWLMNFPGIIGPQRRLLVLRTCQYMGLVYEPVCRTPLTGYWETVVLPLSLQLGPGRYLKQFGITSEADAGRLVHLCCSHLGAAAMKHLDTMLADERTDAKAFEHPCSLHNFEGVVRIRWDPQLRGSLDFSEGEHIFCEMLYEENGQFGLHHSAIYPAPSRRYAPHIVTSDGLATVVNIDLSKARGRPGKELLTQLRGAPTELGTDGGPPHGQ